jgi:hypothetical protein
MVALGFWMGAKLEIYKNQRRKTLSTKKFDYILSPAALVLCLVIIALLRLI